MTAYFTSQETDERLDALTAALSAKTAALVAALADARPYLVSAAHFKADARATDIIFEIDAALAAAGRGSGEDVDGALRAWFEATNRLADTPDAHVRWPDDFSTEQQSAMRIGMAAAIAAAGPR